MSNLIVETMHGFGDNVYAREVVRSLLPRWGERLFVRTAWPQLFHDTGVELLRPTTELRTQRRNVEAYRDWSRLPDGPFQRLHLRYDVRNWAAGTSLPSAMLENAGLLRTGDFSFHPMPAWVDQVRRIRPKGPFAIVHPSSVRTEWRNVARAPRPEYLQQLVHQHQEFEWWEITDLDPPREVQYGPPLTGVTKSIGGLSTEQLIALMSLADVVLTGPGFMLPLAVALRTPVVCLFGGDLPPNLLIEPWMLASPCELVAPNPFCDCGAKGSRHTDESCNKVLDPNAIERAFTRAACGKLLEWDGEYGFYPVNVDGQYDESYYANYAKLACTPMGHEITEKRRDFTNRFFANRPWCDVGPGACAFVEATHASGFDINPTTNARLRELGRYQDPASQFDVLTFWDSLEHIPMEDLIGLLDRCKGAVVSMPVYEDREHVLRSRHFKPAEHMHYWTADGFVDFMIQRGFNHLGEDDFETKLGRDGVLTFAFERD